MNLVYGVRWMEGGAEHSLASSGEVKKGKTVPLLS